ncbi:MAG: D-alanyl-D-alanine carboxypeptidase/D-alanyl-D-alanine-endopeptidase [Bacteroidota bacterium]|nr:D-alanyl-D-alanine carboxypeptidase/D-alanyl-D-alanine-endopeptidase [Bacteroidota bacterium]MDP4192078.1 D-alanyl-D-alanine carboxypeptidase/D-alanyl-D-alanine-endopeptidase [Bacteroidota bacterium]MDP4195767.1 D-alanyl-D-alanine carboxypeptidase/D-alanyl-D-alanine-endopeptidase [Bacteroidota bacterium]
MKNLLNLLFITIFSLNLFAQNKIKDQISILLEDSLFKSSMAAIEVYDLSKKETLFEKNSELLLHPASNMKILTTSAGLYFLGPDYNFETALFHTGQIRRSTLKGSLYILGGGDPDFTTGDLDSLILSLKRQGIKKITGNIYADLSFTDSLFWGKGWMWDDDPSTDAPYLSALNINKNSVITIAEPGENGKKAKVKTIPESKFFKIINHSVTVSDKSLSSFDMQRNWISRRNAIVAKGNFYSGSEPEAIQMNVYNPAQYFLTLFTEKLRENKISFHGKLKISSVPTDTTRLYTFKRPYSNVIMGLNKNSDNLSAEMVLRALSVKYFGRPANADNGIKIVDSLITLSGLDYKSYRIVDGSGVSHYNLINAHLLLNVLRFIYQNRPELFNILYNSFPVAGVDGTLRERMKSGNAFSNVHAKTGTISGVSCLSGYAKSKSGHLLAFSLMFQNYAGSSSRAVKIQNDICQILSEYE